MATRSKWFDRLKLRVHEIEMDPYNNDNDSNRDDNYIYEHKHNREHNYKYNKKHSRRPSHGAMPENIALTTWAGVEH